MGMTASYILKNSTREALDSFKSNLSSLIDLVKSTDYDSRFANSALYKLKSGGGRGTDGSSSSSENIKKYMENANFDNYDNNEPNYHSTSIYWMLQDPIDESKYLVNTSMTTSAVAATAAAAATTPNSDIMLTNKQIDAYNRASINLL
jgi:hypothetical protein